MNWNRETGKHNNKLHDNSPLSQKVRPRATEKEGTGDSGGMAKGRQPAEKSGGGSGGGQTTGWRTANGVQGGDDSQGWDRKDQGGADSGRS